MLNSFSTFVWYDYTGGLPSHAFVNNQIDHPQSKFIEAIKEARNESVIGNATEDQFVALNKAGNNAKHRF